MKDKSIICNNKKNQKGSFLNTPAHIKLKINPNNKIQTQLAQKTSKLVLPQSIQPNIPPKIKIVGPDLAINLKIIPTGIFITLTNYRKISISFYFRFFESLQQLHLFFLPFPLIFLFLFL